MTYNVRRCTGIDGRVTPERIAGIISAHSPDIVALQEVDVSRRRTSFVDQPARIAELTGMKSFFFARLTEGSEKYGIAILCRYPFEVIKADRLPTQYNPPKKESAGAIWIRTHVSGQAVNFIATHFDHHPEERMAHIRALIGNEWLRDSRCQSPVILCGDLNTTRHSPIYSEVHAALDDAQQIFGNYKKTWPGIFPVARIDHIFVSKGVQVQNIEAPWGLVSAFASDHLPLIADVSF